LHAYSSALNMVVAPFLARYFCNCKLAKYVFEARRPKFDRRERQVY
jgi:hypothetical protein